MNFRQLSFHYKYFFDTLLHTITCPLVKGMFYLITLKSPLLSQNAYKNNMVYAITFLIGILALWRGFIFIKISIKYILLTCTCFINGFYARLLIQKNALDRDNAAMNYVCKFILNDVYVNSNFEISSKPLEIRFTVLLTRINFSLVIPTLYLEITKSK